MDNNRNTHPGDGFVCGYPDCLAIFCRVTAYGDGIAKLPRLKRKPIRRCSLETSNRETMPLVYPQVDHRPSNSTAVPGTNATSISAAIVSGSSVGFKRQNYHKIRENVRFAEFEGRTDR